MLFFFHCIEPKLEIRTTMAINTPSVPSLAEFDAVVEVGGDVWGRVPV